MRVVPVSNIQYMRAFNVKSAPKEMAKPVSAPYNASFGKSFYVQHMHENKVDYANNPQEHETDKIIGLQIEKLNRIIDKIQARIDNPKYARQKELLTAKLNHFRELKEDYVSKLVERHLGFTLTYINGSDVYGVDFDDLCDYAVIGLRRAAERFSPSKYPDVHFITYARYWIHEVFNEKILQNQSVSLPRGVASRYSKVLKVRNQLAGELGRRPTNEELAEKLNMPVKSLEKMINNAQYSIVNLDEVVEAKPGKRINLADVIADDYDYEQMEKTLRQEDLEYIKKLINDDRVLTPIERGIIRDRYRFSDGKNGEFVKLASLNELAKKYDYTRERIRQIESDALKKLYKAYYKSQNPEENHCGN